MSAGGMRAHWTKVQYIVHWGLVKFILSLRYPIAGVIVSTSQAAVFLSVQSCFSRAQLVRVVLRDLAEIARGAIVTITRIER